ncbi:MAG: heat shock protein [Candidatus Methanoperedens nitroreducens]|uniref:Heat shock protein n=1 Tax=Candidatus Methanoperedens nitratireducens TaxID=1392998 RepID=A0A0P7ZEY4_9EURY|nr:hypothetical protein [Candidatus Methanoperedens sp. BLZ2]KAB2946087.1 MAG: hypothetical protein F9K14_09020 [Candidatus Methanoperedens sp.]KPQ42072.1 MAG: heat shock protein [Candidatus Methanoperedens sp. BLZ1]MBZ0175029.1 hypothetical protein [Candidatus Methanoperedens nitroreducens]CAG0956787.1 hypothetical protein METP2_00541 [Methanosarcinales archaeon]MCX9076648.1 hypothetical protein [Candidatus Methanoperedens sp.]
MISVAYGLTYIFQTGHIVFPYEPYYFLFIFSIGFVIFTIYFEREKKAFFHRELIGGAIASACLTFLIIACVAGMKYIWEKGLSGIGIETLAYAFSISMILSLILYFVIGKIEVKFVPGDFIRVLSIVFGIAILIMVTVVYGINYIIKINPFPVKPYILFFMFAILFVLASVFYEKRGAVYPWFLLGGAVASACLAFMIAAIIGGLRYVLEKGFTGLGTDTVFYSLSICIILSMVLYNQYDIIKEKL